MLLGIVVWVDPGVSLEKIGSLDQLVGCCTQAAECQVDRLAAIAEIAAESDDRPMSRI